MENLNRVHFVGIGGAGMSGLAKILAQKGIQISGSDLSYSKYIKGLEKEGISVAIGHDAKNLPKDCDLVVVSAAIPKHNPELQMAKQLKVRVLSRGELLAALMNSQRGIAVAGAHGKTTTGSMLSCILESAQLKPTIAIGGEINNLSSNAKLGNGKYFVAEADESDGSFLMIHPEIALITNIEDDHLDFYKDARRMLDAFQRFIDNVWLNGLVVLNGDDAYSSTLKPPKGRRLRRFGLKDTNDYHLKNMELYPDRSRADLCFADKCFGKLELSVVGRHNMVNALGAAATALSIGIPFETVSAALLGFKGVERRFQLIGNYKNIKVVDDYAHHPTEINAALQAARQSHQGRIIAVFQPHRYSRTKRLYKEFGASFKDADIIIVTEVYSAGEKLIPGISGELITQEAKHNFPNKQVEYMTQDVLGDYLLKHSRSGDLVMTLGAGDIQGVGIGFLQNLEA